MNAQVSVDQTLLRQAMQVTHFQTSQELVESALRLIIQSHTPPKLSEFLQQSPLVGLDLDLKRDQDIGRDLNL